MSEALQRLDSSELDFNNPGVRKAMVDLIRSRALASYPGAFSRLLQLAESPDEKTALGAIKLLGQIAGVIVNKSQLDVRLSFDDLRKRESNDPLSSLFDIRSQVIEAEVEDERD